MLVARPGPGRARCPILRIEQLLLVSVTTFVALPSAAIAQSAVDLGTAGSYGVLAGTSITNTGSSVINGNLGVSAGATVTGIFGVDGGPGVVNGTINIANAAAAQAQLDLTHAYNTAAAEVATSSAGTLVFADTTLTPGVYNAESTIDISGTLTLNGENEANPIFVFQAGSTLGTEADSQVLLTNGAQAKDIFWQVGSSATFLGGSSVFEGTVLALTSITVDAGSTVNGDLLARTGTVTLSNDTVTAIPETPSTAVWLAGFSGLVLIAERFQRHFRREAQ
jgi:hypothetical protein